MGQLISVVGLATALSQVSLAQTVQIEGYVYGGVEAGCLLLDDANTGITYELRGCDPFPCLEGFWVVAWGMPHPDWLTTCMQGIPFEVLEAYLIWWWPPETCTIAPEKPAPADPVEITLTGTWPDTCVPNIARVAVNDNTVNFDVVVSYPPGTVCFAHDTPWSLTETVGPLCPGTYSVRATIEVSDLGLLLAAPPDMCGFTVAQAPTFSLKAVRKDPQCIGGANAGELCTRDEDCDSLDCGGAITPTNSLTASPGDVIVAEIYASDWSPNGERLRAWQTGIDRIGFYSGRTGDIRPLGSDVIFVDPWGCQTDDDCWKEGYVCPAPGKNCYGPYPEKGAFIDSARADYIFFELNSSPTVNPFDYWFGDHVGLDEAPPYSPPAKYSGTLVLRVSQDACGRFTIPFIADRTYMADTYQTSLEVVTESLTIAVPGDCPYPHLVASNPPNCSIDAREPTDTDGSPRGGRFSMNLLFDGPLGGLSPADFAVTSPADSPPHTIKYVLGGGPWKDVTLWFDRAIPVVGYWTCVTCLPHGEEVCITWLPGDVNGSGTSDPADILALIDHLDGHAEPPLETWQCDIDRSGRCAPADILRETDLLNGAAAYDVWLGQTLPLECPSAP